MTRLAELTRVTQIALEMHRTDPDDEQTWADYVRVRDERDQAWTDYRSVVTEHALP